jgi:hypothetical protein
MKVCMNDIASQIIASSKIITAPTGEAVTVSNEVTPPTINKEAHAPMVADVLGLGVFFGETATEVCSPSMLEGIKSKTDAIVDYVRNNIKTYSEEAVKSFILKLSGENNWDSLKPIEKLDKFYDYVDLQTRIKEIKNQKSIIKQLKESVNA